MSDSHFQLLFIWKMDVPLICVKYKMAVVKVYRLLILFLKWCSGMSVYRRVCVCVCTVMCASHGLTWLYCREDLWKSLKLLLSSFTVYILSNCIATWRRALTTSWIPTTKFLKLEETVGVSKVWHEWMNRPHRDIPTEALTHFMLLCKNTYNSWNPSNNNTLEKCFNAVDTLTVCQREIYVNTCWWMLTLLSSV